MKKAPIEVQLNHCHLMLDILFMIQVDLKTGCQNPIAWIDEGGTPFFPQLYSTMGGILESDHCDLEKDEESDYVEPNGTPEIKLHLQIEVNGANSRNLEEYVEESNICSKRIKIGQKHSSNDNELDVNENYNKKSDAKMEEVVEEVQQIGKSSPPKFEAFCENIDIDIVKDMFVKGMNPCLSANIIEIKRCSSSIMQTRWEIFCKQVEITQNYRGDPNVRCGWLASAKDALSSITTYGFAHCGSIMKSTHGVGVHLIPVNCALTSARYCNVDDNGVQHMVLCRVILGNMELVDPGSRQFQPSSENFDSGVDDLQNPSSYIIWNMNANTHIYPEYIVSFKVPQIEEENQVGKESRFDIPTVTSLGHGRQIKLNSSTAVSERKCHPSQGFDNKSQGNAPSIGSSTCKTPKSPWLPFSVLFDVISTQIAHNDMKLVNVNYELLRNKKISRDQFIRRLRSIVGDELLRSAITGLHGKLPPNLACSSSSKVLKQEPEC
ncbi:NAD(+) ADP-ribosyltransferase [Bertholletia excelsa]